MLMYNSSGKTGFIFGGSLKDAACQGQGETGVKGKSLMHGHTGTHIMLQEEENSMSAEQMGLLAEEGYKERRWTSFLLYLSAHLGVLW